MAVAISTEIVAVCLAYMVIYVPVLGPKLTPDEANQHWFAAVVAALVVLAFGCFIVRTALRARAASGPAAVAAVDADDEVVLPRIPDSLRIEAVPAVWVRRAAVFSLATLPFSIYFEVHLWMAWLAILAPWVPIVAIEARHKASRDMVFAAFGLLVMLQILHMVEHSTQVGELFATGGSFAKSHGVIGQLDFETVHFVADTTLWLCLGMLAIHYRARNAWLWVAFAAASMHQIEHLYLFWLYVGEHTVYLSGGAAGIMGKHGLIGSPLDRPYLHFTYNFIVFVPMLIAFWEEARYRDRLRGAPRATVGEATVGAA